MRLFLKSKHAEDTEVGMLFFVTNDPSEREKTKA
jgi:hypothetical protein